MQMGEVKKYRPGELHPIRYTSIHHTVELVEHEIACAPSGSLEVTFAPGQEVTYHYPLGRSIRIKMAGIPSDERTRLASSIRGALERKDQYGFITMPVTEVSVLPVDGEDYDEIYVVVDTNRLVETMPLTVMRH